MNISSDIYLSACVQISERHKRPFYKRHADDGCADDECADDECADDACATKHSLVDVRILTYDII